MACRTLLTHQGSTSCHGECGSPDAAAADARSVTMVRTSASAAATSACAEAGFAGGNSAV
jgi:hypothetical protein